MASKPKGTTANPLYGSVDDQTQRFDIAQDPRRMYPVSAFGKLYGKEMVPNRLQSGSTGYFGKPVANLIPIGDGTTLASLGNLSEISSTKRAIRLGVNGTTGGDYTGTSDFSFVFANRLMTDTPINLYVMMSSGEAVYRNTDASADQYGAISEPFTIAGTTATWVGATTAITTSVDISTLVLTGPYAYTPNQRNVSPNDIIKLAYNDGTFSYHRIQVISGVNVTIAPATLAKNGTATAIKILRTGLRSMSRVVTVTDLGNKRFYNYYAGNASDLLTQPGSVQCWTQDTSGGFLNHYQGPLLVDNAGTPIAAPDGNVYAKDVIYYKTYLLYGYGKNISWTVPGFPTSFTTGFGTTDFPAENTTVVANDDEFMSFEMLGDNVLALFKNSIWQVRATGTVPEFNFTRLIEPIGCFGGYLERPSTSSRGRVYYKTTDGIAELSGQIAVKISDPIRSLTSQATRGNLTWEPTTDTLFVNEGSNENDGWLYNIPSQTWARLDLSNLGIAPVIARCITGNINSIASCMQAGVYNSFTNTIYFLDSRVDGPAGVTTSTSPRWTWSSPVVSMGDDYGGFKLGSFQIEGDANCDWEIYGGPFPTSMTLRDSGSGATTGNRIPLGQKVDDPFIQIVLYAQFVGDLYYPGKIYGINLYREMRGR